MREWPEWRLALLWWITLPAVLLILPLGLLAKRRALRLPEAAGSPRGLAGGGATLQRLLVVGESPVAGVGVEDYRQSIGACVARQLGTRLGATVHWQALGWNGIRIAGLLHELQVQDLAPADLVLVIVGVNDTTGLTRRSDWRAGLLELARLLAIRTGAQIVLAGVPPLQEFSAVPQPLRWWFGLRAALLDLEMARGAPGAGYVHASVSAPVLPQLLAPDGYHPSALGCEVWAAHLAAEFIDLSPGPAALSN